MIPTIFAKFIFFAYSTLVERISNLFIYTKAVQLIKFRNYFFLLMVYKQYLHYSTNLHICKYYVKQNPPDTSGGFLFSYQATFNR